MTMRDTILDNVLLYAVQRAITCPGCGHVLDVDKAVLIDDRHVRCSTCWCKFLGRMRDKHGAEQAQAHLDSVEILFGKHIRLRKVPANPVKQLTLPLGGAS